MSNRKRLNDGGVAQCLGRWSLASGLSLIWADIWLTGDHSVTLCVNCPIWVSQLGQLSLPSLCLCHPSPGSVNE